MSPKLFRLLFAATVVAGVSAPMLGAYAAPQPRSVDAYNPPRGFEVPEAKNPYQPLDIYVNDTVSWVIWEGEHTITPKNPKQWGDGGSGDTHLTPDSAAYTAKGFKTAGDYFYYCKVHGNLDPDGTLTGMWGVIHVIDPTPTTTAPPPPPPPPPPSQSTTSTTATTRPGATPPATTATAPPATGRPAPTAPAPTTTTAKGEKEKKPKDETTTTSSTLPPPIDLPDSAIIPTLPSASTTSSADPGAQAPTDTPEGDAVALLKGKKNDGGHAVKLLIVSGLGLGALGIGSAGYKYANRSSKYFPA